MSDLQTLANSMLAHAPALTLAIGAAVAVGILVVIVMLAWPRKPLHDPVAEQRMAELNARVQTMGELLARAQSQLQHTVHERLDAVTARLGDSMRTSTKDTAEHLQQLHARLALIDNAQKNITDLASQVTSLQSVLANKQSRGAFGQSRMEMIIQDGLPKDCYEFQATLTNKSRPDCVVHLPDGPPLVIDAKFPLEAVTAFREAKSDDDRKFATARVRTDIAKHVGDIADKYLIPGETQDMALMFVPSESVYAELHDGFDDVVQKAYRARVIRDHTHRYIVVRQRRSVFLAGDLRGELDGRPAAVAEQEIREPGEALDVGFNVSYLLDILANVTSSEVECSLGDANSSMLITLPDTPNFKYVVMPMRI
jgi:hypothetical protein